MPNHRTASARFASSGGITRVLAVTSALVPLLLGTACQPSRVTPPHSSKTAEPSREQRAAPASDSLDMDPELVAALTEVRERYRLPGLAAMALDAHAVLKQGAVGVRAIGHAEPLRVGDRFHLGSNTKAMTATLIALYVEDGTFRWDDRLARLFPGERTSEGLGGATLEQLLKQQSGISDTWLSAGVREEWWDTSVTPVEHRRRLAAALLTHEPVHAPGTRFEYANANYMLAGAALERATGESWEALINKRLFEPLHMRSCGFGAPAHAGQLDAPWGHQTVGEALTPVAPGPESDNPPALGPAGTVHCSLEDWARFVQLHVRGRRGGEALLRKETFEHLQAPWPGSEYASGWGVVQRGWAKGEALTHSGSNTLFYATVWAAPNAERVYLAATNAAPADAASALDEAIAWLVTHEG